MADMTITGPAPDLASLLKARPFLSLDETDGLCFEGVSLKSIAMQYGTPVWVYGAGEMRRRYRALNAALAAQDLPAHIHYAVKANGHLAILDLFRRLGAGADVVSLGEFLRARRAGIAPDDVVYSGVGKSEAELKAALAAGIGQINVESAEELAMLSGIASGLGVQATVALRMNPDVDAGTHAKITTGLAENKFGIAAADIPALYAHAASLPGLRPVGLALHIGSQILSPTPYATAYAKGADMVRHLRAQGQNVEALDLGGGIGIGYGAEPGLDLAAYAATIRRTVGGLGLRLMVEPGRYLTGPAGLLLASVILQKHTQKRFVVLDAAMTELMRPALYEAWHGILPLDAADFSVPVSPADVVGPVCESADSFAENRALPDLPPGRLVALLDAGAYGAEMSSTYNARPRAASVLADAGTARLITPRQSIEDLWADEILPG